MSDAGIIAMEFGGKAFASFDRRWAYSRAVIPGVTMQRRLVSSYGLQSQYHTYAPQASAYVGESHAEAGQTAAPRPRPASASGAVDYAMVS